VDERSLCETSDVHRRHAFIYSNHSKTALHGPACFMMNTGFTLPGFPSMGAWATYGLGSETDDLPAFVVLPGPRGLPPRGIINWGAGFLPAEHQAFSSTRSFLVSVSSSSLVLSERTHFGTEGPRAAETKVHGVSSVANFLAGDEHFPGTAMQV
jgi:hypothetical protein